MKQYNHKKIEKKWSNFWKENKIFTPDLAKAKKPFYALFMFPYPSAEGLHIGNFYAFTCVDVMAKYKKLCGFDVFEPVGFDAFGIHSENYALKIEERPRKMLDRTEENFRGQLVSSGIGCDWTREIDTTRSEYYKWTQWIFSKLFERGLAVQKEAFLNWCPSCKTVLADEQIVSGVCERCKSIPQKKIMKQWFFKITNFSDRLLSGLSEMDWSEITKLAQKNWIGRSEGAEVVFEINGEKIKVFTTRPDTLFGATYFVLSPEHAMVKKITTKEQKNEVEKYIKEAGVKSDLMRTESKEKTGVFTGAYAINPVNGEKIPVWIADYVLMGYGTGAIMAVPAHDERDFEFAKKYELPIIQVLSGGDVTKEPFLGDGVHVNSGFLDGLNKEESIKKIIAWLQEKGRGEKVVNFKLRDWCVSRQRYWGPPIPVVHCEKCGVVAIPEKDLPVLLPDLNTGWEPSGEGKGPLAEVSEFVNVRCPKCGGKARRETDVMDNFLDSSWYFYRYLSPGDENKIFDQALARQWLPVDMYIGGNEHAVLHLMYTRFITMIFHDLGLVDFDNPFKRFRANGMILKDGHKMSKSKGNVVNPEEYGEKIGYDALKAYLLFLGPMSEDRSFSDDGVLGTMRWVEKIFRLEKKVKEGIKDGREIEIKLNKTIKQVSEDFEEQKYNTSVAKLMELTNVLLSSSEFSKETWFKFLAIIGPFLPVLAEEMWARSEGKGKSIFENKNWPEYDSKVFENEGIELAVQVNGKFRGSIVVDKDISQKEAEEAVFLSGKFGTYLENKQINRVIFVKNRIINFMIF